MSHRELSERTGHTQSQHHHWAAQFLQHEFGIHEHHGKVQIHGKHDIASAAHKLEHEKGKDQAKDLAKLVKMEHEGNASERAFAKAVLKQIEHDEHGNAHHGSRAGRASAKHVLHEIRHDEQRELHRLGFPHLHIHHK